MPCDCCCAGEHYKKNVDADEDDQNTGVAEAEHHRKSVARKYKKTPKFVEINKKTGEVLLSAICLNSGYTSRVMVRSVTRNNASDYRANGLMG